MCVSRAVNVDKEKALDKEGYLFMKLSKLVFVTHDFNLYA
jgi:hypothetical protein